MPWSSAGWSPATWTAPGRFDCVRVLPCARYPTLQDAMRTYLADPAVAAHGMPQAAAMAVATERMTHSGTSKESW